MIRVGGWLGIAVHVIAKIIYCKKFIPEVYALREYRLSGFGGKHIVIVGQHHHRRKQKECGHKSY